MCGHRKNTWINIWQLVVKDCAFEGRSFRNSTEQKITGRPYLPRALSKARMLAIGAELTTIRTTNLTNIWFTMSRLVSTWDFRWTCQFGRGKKSCFCLHSSACIALVDPINIRRCTCLAACKWPISDENMAFIKLARRRRRRCRRSSFFCQAALKVTGWRTLLLKGWQRRAIYPLFFLLLSA